MVIRRAKIYMHVTNVYMINNLVSAGRTDRLDGTGIHQLLTGGHYCHRDAARVKLLSVLLSVVVAREHQRRVVTSASHRRTLRALRDLHPR